MPNKYPEDVDIEEKTNWNGGREPFRDHLDIIELFITKPTELRFTTGTEIARKLGYLRVNGIPNSMLIPYVKEEYLKHYYRKYKPTSGSPKAWVGFSMNVIIQEIVDTMEGK